jgi:hypothetical protein
MSTASITTTGTTTGETLAESGHTDDSGDSTTKTDTVAKNAPDALINMLTAPLLMQLPGKSSSIDGIEQGNDIKSGDLSKIAGMLDGTSGQLMKCSLGDIIFLVMLIMIQSTADQREASYDGITAQKQSTAAIAKNIYELKTSAAVKRYDATIKQLDEDRIFAIVSIVIGIVSAGISAFSFVASVMSMIIQTVNTLLKTVQMIAKVTQSITQIIQSTNQIIKGSITYDTSEKCSEMRLVSSRLAADAQKASAMLSQQLSQIGSAQDAYCELQRNVSSKLDALSQILQENHSNKLTIARSI